MLIYRHADLHGSCQCKCHLFDVCFSRWTSTPERNAAEAPAPGTCIPAFLRCCLLALLIGAHSDNDSAVQGPATYCLF